MPQRKKQKEQKKFIEEVKKGDQVVTIGGIHGRIFEMDDTTVTIEVEKGGKIKFDKTAISYDSSKKTNSK